jgi:hypothetical protein
MEFKIFTKKVVNLFQSRKKEKRINTRIKRGRAKDCSSEIEELVAIMISNILQDKYSILIDYPLSYKTKKRTKTFYPDISIIEDSKLRGIIEVKIDLGYLDKEWIKNNQNIFKSIKISKKVTYNKNVGLLKKEIDELSIYKNLKRAVIVITGRNDHDNLEGFVNKQKNCFILMPKHHPNDSIINKDNKNKLIREISSDDKQWNKMIQYFKQNYK